MAEPVQVYLHLPERERLKRLTDMLDTTKSDVLRLSALEDQLTDPGRHPVLDIVGVCHVPDPPGVSTVRDLDDVLADLEFASWEE